LPILLDHNVPAGIRTFLAGGEVRTMVETQWPRQLENVELLEAAEAAAFDVLLTSDQNIPYPAEPGRSKTCSGCPRFQHMANCSKLCG
jgi:hypothetical protein